MLKRMILILGIGIGSVLGAGCAFASSENEEGVGDNSGSQVTTPQTIPDSNNGHAPFSSGLSAKVAVPTEQTEQGQPGNETFNEEASLAKVRKTEEQAKEIERFPASSSSSSSSDGASNESRERDEASWDWVYTIVNRSTPETWQTSIRTLETKYNDSQTSEQLKRTIKEYLEGLSHMQPGELEYTDDIKNGISPGMNAQRDVDVIISDCRAYASINQQEEPTLQEIYERWSTGYKMQ
jgi:uncharacterized phage infection (PIP) family protein YhgE